MQVKFAMQNIIQGKSGRWVDLQNLRVFVDSLNNKIILPSSLAGQDIDEVDVNSIQQPQVDPNKMQLVQALMIANTTSYKRLQEYLDNLANIIKLGGEFKAEAEQFEKFNQFVNSYSPIEQRMRDFLHSYLEKNRPLIEQLKQTIAATDAQVAPKSNVPTQKCENPMNVQKFGIYRFPFLSQEKLFLGDIEEFPVIPQVWNYTGTHFKQWLNIKGIPFLVNGYKDDEYSCVNRVLASQIGKLLGFIIKRFQILLSLSAHFLLLLLLGVRSAVEHIRLHICLHHPNL